MKIVTATLAGLLMSGSALAGAEVGAIVGYDSMSASSGGDSLSGLAFGLRGGTRTDSGLAFEGQFLRHSGSTEVMGIEASVKASRGGLTGAIFPPRRRQPEAWSADPGGQDR